ncbi:hypothetical protein D9611_009063 [Ephemerocybe angulata]|uniref:Nephrocystin 3-like N-terminal domain-containing protein n=1 Tax=Ephemerocybe angulata TaxID=980116 RepID=A0A8H5CDM0_9AGAR|nr:hypothetical protein D9611_009063 [Tulosesus angulatus]
MDRRNLQFDHGKGRSDERGSRSFQNASTFNAHEMTIQNAGRDIIVNPAPISSAEASIDEVAAWLKGANFRSVYRLSLEARMDDTGSWLVATFEFGEFVRQKGTVVWATGLPGSGKTILASISVEHLEDNFSDRTDVAVIYAFLRYSEKHALLDIIAGLLAQLVSSHRAAFLHILPTYKRAKNYRDELSCSQAIKLLKSSLNLFSDAFIVIDGLDEVGDATKDGLLGVLTSLPGHIHILFTCRPLELFMHRYTPEALHIPVQARTKDIEIYVAQRVKESTKLSRILSDNPTVAERFTRLIVEKSKGMFLLARLQMELILERCTTIGSLLRALETLPSGINDMYRATMDRIGSQSEEDVSIAHRAFLWILHARDPLSPQDLQHALTFSYQDMKFLRDNLVSMPVLLSICCGLVAVEDRTEYLGLTKQGEGEEGNGEAKEDVVETGEGKYMVVRFIHYSAKEYLKRFEFPHLPDPHDLLAVTSAACMDEHMATLAAALNWERQFELYTHPAGRLPLLRYALLNWGDHAMICDGRQALNPYIHSFLSKHNAYFLTGPVGNHYVEEVPAGIHLAAAYDLVHLISSGTLVYSTTHGTKTPFHVAAQFGRIAALDALLKGYSGVHVRDEAGRTPLHTNRLTCEVAQRLLGLSPSDVWRAYPLEIVGINAEDHEGDSPIMNLFIYFHFGGFPVEAFFDVTTDSGRLLQLFTSHPDFDIDTPDSGGNTLFSRACSFPYSGVPRFLISSFPNLKIDTKNKRNETPFMRACDSFLEVLVRWFLSRDPGSHKLLQQEDDEGKTTLERIVAYDGRVTARKMDFSRLRFAGQDSGVDRILRVLLERADHVRVVRNEHEALPVYELRNSRNQESHTFHVSLKDGTCRYEDERTPLMLLASYRVAVTVYNFAWTKLTWSTWVNLPPPNEPKFEPS